MQRHGEHDGAQQPLVRPGRHHRQRLVLRNAARRRRGEKHVVNHDVNNVRCAVNVGRHVQETSGGAVLSQSL